MIPATREGVAILPRIREGSFSGRFMDPLQSVRPQCLTVTATTPSTPAITSVKAKGNTVTVTYTKSADATGYDVVLGSSVKSVNGEKRPVDFGELVKKNVKGNTVTVTFKNVPAGTYYAGLHSFNRTSEDGKKVFSKWSNAKKVTVK